MADGIINFLQKTRDDVMPWPTCFVEYVRKNAIHFALQSLAQSKLLRMRCYKKTLTI